MLVLTGAALRGLASATYRPALLVSDSFGYVGEELPPRLHPSGYPVFVRAVLAVHDQLMLVPIAHHVLGLATALLLYALLVRLGLAHWLAALATAPTLLDGYQLNVEEYVLAEPLFELLVVGACVVLLWRRPVGLLAVAAAGGLLAAATLTRTVAVFLVFPLALAAIFASSPLSWRSQLVRVAALVCAFALPVVAYAAWYNSARGSFALAGFDGRILYGRVAPFADCSGLELPDHERALCPSASEAEQLTIEDFTWSRDVSPLYQADVPPEMSRDGLARDFSRRIVRNQPLDYLGAVATDFVRGFAPTRTTYSDEPPVEKWQFQTRYPVFRRVDNPQRPGLIEILCPPESDPAAPRPCRKRWEESAAFARAHGADELAVSHGPAVFLSAYQRVAFLPGPVLAAGLVVGFLAAAGLGRARRSPFRVAAFVFASASLVLLVGSVTVTHFSWRYQLPAFVLIPPAAALGLVGLTGRGRNSTQPDLGR